MSFAIAGLILFMVYFATALAWTFRPHARAQYDQVAQLPLQEELPCPQTMMTT